MAWGISEKAPQREKIFARYADDIQGLNSTGTVDYRLYSYLWDIGRELADKSYEQGKKDAIVHAHWIDDSQSIGGHYYDILRCSHCGESYNIRHEEAYMHCPECGAVMDGKETDDEQ